MLRNFLITAVRHARRYKAYAGINVLGLTLGLTTCLLIGLYVQHHLRYDTFHEDAERIYRLTRQTVIDGRITDRQANTPAALGPTLRDEYASVEAATRLLFPYPNDVLVTIGNERFYEPGFLWADPSVFDVFDFSLVRGNPETALAEPYSVVITESLAQRYFGEADPVGKPITVEGWTEDTYTVAGVPADVPERSHLQFEMLASMQGLDEVYPSLFEGEGAWTNSIMYTYVRTTSPGVAESLASALPAFTERHLENFGERRGRQYRFALQPLTGVHLDADVDTMIDTPNTSVPLRTMMADPDFVETMGIDIVAGRDLTGSIATDASVAFLLSESAVQALGFAAPQAAIGTRLRWEQGGGKTGTVIGVVRDVHARSLHETIEPMLIHVLPERYSTFVLRIRGNDVSETLSHVREQWSAHVPDQPFDYAFLDEKIDRLYRTDRQIGQLTGLFALLAVLIACVGLFGLASYTAARRRKEIGIRKALGATIRSVVGLLSREYVLLVVGAFVVAVPLAVLAARQWLQDFAYRIDLGPWIFVGAGLVTLAVALLAVSTQAYRAACVDPSSVLRSD